MREELTNLGAGEDGGQLVVVLRFDLGEDLPVLMPEHLKEEDLRGSGRLANRLGLPLLHVLHVEDVVAKLALGEPGRIAAEVLVDQSHVTVVGMAGAIAVVAKVEELRELGHRLVGMVVVERIGVGSSWTGARHDELGDGGGWIDFGLFHSASILLRSRHVRPTPRHHRPEENRLTLPQSGLVQQPGDGKPDPVLS